MFIGGREFDKISLIYKTAFGILNLRKKRVLSAPRKAWRIRLVVEPAQVIKITEGSSEAII
jgi:hypothetical protein